MQKLNTKSALVVIREIFSNLKKLSRWYDRFSHFSALIHITQDLSSVVQDNMGKTINKGVLYYKTKFCGNQEFKNLGREVILGLYQSKKKRRWYDHVPNLHDAVNNVRTSLPEEALHQLNQKSAPMVEYINRLKIKTNVDNETRHIIIEVVEYLESEPLITTRES